MCSEIILQNELTYFDDFMVQTVPNSWITIFLHTLLLWIGSSEYALKKITIIYEWDVFILILHIKIVLIKVSILQKLYAFKGGKWKQKNTFLTLRFCNLAMEFSWPIRFKMWLCLLCVCMYEERLVIHT